MWKVVLEEPMGRTDVIATGNSAAEAVGNIPSHYLEQVMENADYNFVVYYDKET